MIAKAAATPEVATELTAWLRQPSGTQTLRPIQAQALLQLILYGGLFAVARVGAGKTLIAGLAAVVTGAVRPLIVVPSGLRAETEAHLAALRQHWRIPHVRVIGYHDLSSKTKGPKLLDDFAPDLLVFDEVHRLKRKQDAACARRVARYLHERPATKVAGLSGTIVRRSFRDYAHLLRWTCKRHAPIPYGDDLIKAWALCLDDDEGNPDTWHTPDFSLLEPILGGPIHNKEQARERFATALDSTPGVVISRDGFDAVGLAINPIRIETPDNMVEAWRLLRKEAVVAADDWPLPDKQTVWAIAQQYALGFCYIHDPRPPEDWMQRRREWCGFCRRVLEDSLSYDTETQVRDACLRGDLPDHAWRAWDAVRESFVPNTVPVWFSHHALLAAADWGQQGGIVWTSHTAFAVALAEATGWPYYGEKGIDHRTKRHIRVATEPTIIASVRANIEGRNLQIDCGPDGKGYCRNLFCSPSKASADWEQQGGRTHRDRQTRDVTIDYFVGCRENFVALETALCNARTTTEEVFRITPKLLQAGVEIRLPSADWAIGEAY